MSSIDLAPGANTVAPHVQGRVRLRYSVELHYRLAGAAEFLLSVHAAQTARQSVVDEFFAIDPYQAAAFDVDAVTGNRIAAFGATASVLTVRYAATVELAHRITEPSHVIAESPSALPASTLRYLFPSRYCQADLVQKRAWELFGHLPRGYAQILRVRDWIRESLQFRIGVSGTSTTALDTLRDGAGVCRDFAHVMIAYCRALNYPARFVTGVDYGADPTLGPPDFHAYVEVFMGGAWYLFDPTGISPTTGLVRIATGRDAAEVSFATIFGPVQTSMPVITVDATDDPVRGLILPVNTGLAVSTA